jgi:hypothetical protein
MNNSHGVVPHELNKSFRLSNFNPAQLIVTVRVFEDAAPGFTAVMDAVPAFNRSLAGTATVTWFEFTTVVVR